MSCGTSTSWPRFLSTPSARRATSGVCAVPVNLLFLSTPSARRATLVQPSAQPRVHISIHALREEGDFQLVRGFNSQHKFLSTPSARRATLEFTPMSSQTGYFYPRPPRGGRPLDCKISDLLVQISIHALREEGDSKNRDKISIFKQIIQHSARI